MEYYYIEEVREAIEAADEAIERLQAAQRELDNAGSWGLLDMFGGGLFTTMLKHSRIDAAKEEIEAARSAIKRFKDELEDVGKNLTLDIDIGGFATFADYFFDNIFTDVFIQSKISDAKRQVEEAIYQIREIKRELNSLLSEAEI